MDRRKELNVNTATNGENSNTFKKPQNRKAPVIKQTLTSMYRIAKANPLLLLKNDKIEGNKDKDDFGVNKIKLPKSIFQPSVTPTAKEQSTVAPVSKQSVITKSIPRTNSQKSESKNIALTRTTSLRTNKTKMPSNNLALQKAGSVKHQTKTSDNSKNVKNATNPQPRRTKRRSLSAEHYDRQRKLIQVKIEQVLDKSSTQSLNNVQRTFATHLPNVSAILEEKRVTFKTPNAYLRRSMSVYTPTPYHRSTLSHTSTPTPTSDDLKIRLENWLRKHKKPTHSYRHLRCFGVDRHNDDDNKENIEVVNEGASSSYEDLKIPPQPIADDTPKAGSSGSNTREVAQAALDDLHKLIVEGYSREQCEAWLEKISHKYQYLEEEPQYWECRAAIEQSRGNIISAVECLQAAIVQGAEVGTVDRSLEQLLEKFSLLNISTTESVVEENRKKRDRARIVLDARSVFKSSIIQFAVQERTLKKNKSQEPSSEKRFLVTPVRRSTRTSRSRYTLTPGVRVCSSLQELDKSYEHIFDFRNNNALSNI